MTIFLNVLASGIGIGSVYALVALGYSFIYRTTGVFNLAQGQLLAYGALFTYTLYSLAHVPAIAAAIAVAAIVGGIALLLERVAIWPLMRGSEASMNWVLSTLGAGVLLTGIAERHWGTLPLPVNPYFSPPFLHSAGVILQTPYVLAAAAAVVIAIAIDLLQRLTLFGKTLKALGENRAAVEAAGVNVFRVGSIAFIAGGAIAGFGGFILAPITFAQSDAGFSIGILAFAALAIGGFGSHWGALLGGWIVGIGGNAGATYLGLQYENAVIFGLMVACMMVRPGGIWSPRTARRV